MVSLCPPKIWSSVLVLKSKHADGGNGVRAGQSCACIAMQGCVLKAVGFMWHERFEVAQRCRSNRSSVEGLSSVSGVELDLLRACVSAGGERSLRWAALLQTPGFCSGGNWLAHLDSLEQTNMHVV